MKAKGGLEIHHVRCVQNQIEKMARFKIFEHKKAGHYKILACDQF